MRTTIVLIGGIAIIAGCRELVDARAKRELQVALTTTAQAASSVNPPFISVADSIAVTATASDGPHVAGQHLNRGQSSAELFMTVPEGSVQLDAKVFSAVGTISYHGSGSVDVRGRNWSTTLPVVAQTPVLLIAPDTVVVALTDQLKRFKVHNRGLAGLSWQIVDTLAPSVRSQCRVVCFHIDTAAKSGVAAGDSTIVTLFVIQQWANPITLQFSSKDGTLPVVFVRR